MNMANNENLLNEAVQRFKNVELAHNGHLYVHDEIGNSIAAVCIRSRGMLIKVDKFPQEERVYSTEIPVRTLDDLVNDLRRVGIILNDTVNERDPSILICADFWQKQAGEQSDPAKRIIIQKTVELLNRTSDIRSVNDDSARLEWLMRNVSGEELRRIGIEYSAGCQRADIDSAMFTDNSGG